MKLAVKVKAIAQTAGRVCQTGFAGVQNIRRCASGSRPAVQGKDSVAQRGQTHQHSAHGEDGLGVSAQFPSGPVGWWLRENTVCCPGWGLPEGQGYCVWHQ